MTDLKQVHTYMDQDMIKKVKARAKQYNMTVSKYLEYLVMKDLQKEQRSTTKENITLAYKYRADKAYFFL